MRQDGPQARAGTAQAMAGNDARRLPGSGSAAPEIARRARPGGGGEDAGGLSGLNEAAANPAVNVGWVEQRDTQQSYDIKGGDGYRYARPILPNCA